jgi:predicted transcriptional regulator
VSSRQHVVGVRLSDEHLEKLKRLAKTTYRGRGDVMRLLIDQAEALLTRDVTLVGGALVSAGADAEASHV